MSWSPAAASGAAWQGAKGGLGGLEQGSALLWAEKGVQLKSTKLPAPTGPHNLSSKPKRGRTAAGVPTVAPSPRPVATSPGVSPATSNYTARICCDKQKPIFASRLRSGEPKARLQRGTGGWTRLLGSKQPYEVGEPEVADRRGAKPQHPHALGRRSPPRATDTRAAFRNDGATTFVGASRPRLRLVAPGSGGAPTPRAKRRAWSAPRGRLRGPPRTRAA